ncbi:MAG: hypothetical protein GX616_25205 [Planctomycetes bacterium]|nr:hypothetical protein [Planctomycetota bacterium]
MAKRQAKLEWALHPRHLWVASGLLLVVFASRLSAADSAYLYGIHWWGHTQGQGVDTGPATMLDCPTYGGWDLETVITHSASWWQAPYFTGLYQDLYTNKNMTIITRIDYDWGETVPSPTNPNYASWPTSVVNTVNTLRNYCHIWLIGNEPNIVGEGNNWPDNHVTPAGYATIYRDVRNAIHNSAQASPAGEHIVLIAAPSPGGVIAGVRWMDGNQWLGQVIDNIPADEIDGFAIHAYGNFHSDYVSQLNLIDGKGLQSRPVYITEWNTVSSEAVMAQFVRDCYADLNTWNQTPGKHNIRCLCWFVYDADQQAGGGWNSYSIEYWKNNGEPAGSPNDVYTAFQQTVDLRYPAGLVGTRPMGRSIGRSPESFAREIYYRDELANDTFEVWNAGTDTLNYSITDNAVWLSVDPSSGSSTGEHDTIAISYDTKDLAIGSHSATITISDPAASPPTTTVTVSLSVVDSPYAPADFNRDTIVDQADLSVFLSCLTGRDAGPPASDCKRADIDWDNDVDQHDFGLFQRCISGTGNPADPDCAD